MNSTANRLRAIIVTAVFFAASAFALLAAIRAIAALPFVLPGFDAIGSYDPRATLAAIANPSIFVALSAAYLVSGALVVLIDTQYCDRMLAIFADVLLMTIAAIVGFAAGYWILLRLLGTGDAFDFAALRPTGICAAIVLLVSLVPPHRLRGNLFARLLSALALLIAGPLLLLNLS